MNKAPFSGFQRLYSLKVSSRGINVNYFNSWEVFTKKAPMSNISVRIIFSGIGIYMREVLIAKVCMHEGG